MKLQNDGETGVKQPSTNADMVAEYLRMHPEFFEDFPEVLRDIEIRHRSGDAVILLERQVSALRDDNARMKVRFEQLLTLAKSNDDLIKRIHELALALMGGGSPEEIFGLLADRLAREFDADHVRTVIFSKPARTDLKSLPEFVGSEWSDRVLFTDVLSTKAPKCGGLTEAQILSLFPSDADATGSAVILPLSGKSWDGLLIIFSTDDARFHHDMGTDFLAYLGDIVSLIVDPWVV
ncbi:MAG TPA: hypothetical protein DGR97_10105 [Gammaproteobacteria bacterium]|nr:hypothetical protein [Gammaproteobacteria bacterium]